MKDDKNQCVHDCPAGYMVSAENYTVVVDEAKRDKLKTSGKQCVRCEGPCPKGGSLYHLLYLEQTVCSVTFF